MVIFPTFFGGNMSQVIPHFEENAFVSTTISIFKISLMYYQNNIKIYKMLNDQYFLEIPRHSGSFCEKLRQQTSYNQFM